MYSPPLDSAYAPDDARRSVLFLTSGPAMTRLTGKRDDAVEADNGNRAIVPLGGCDFACPTSTCSALGPQRSLHSLDRSRRGSTGLLQVPNAGCALV